MADVFEIPVVPGTPQAFDVVFPNQVRYLFRLQYLFTPDDCWLLDIYDDIGNPIIGGIPLVAGEDLLSQYAYLGFAASLYCTSGTSGFEDPKWWNLGVTAHLWLYG